MSQTVDGRCDIEMSEMSCRTPIDGSLPPSETLELLTNETRRAILTTLLRADDAPLGFTALRRRAGVDQSGRFNYHLQRLCEQVVSEAGDGYELTAGGERFLVMLSAVPPLDAPSDGGTADSLVAKR